MEGQPKFYAPKKQLKTAYFDEKATIFVKKTENFDKKTANFDQKQQILECFFTQNMGKNKNKNIHYKLMN